MYFTNFVQRERERESYALSAFREVPGGRRYDGARVKKKKRKNMLHKREKGEVKRMAATSADRT